MIKILDKIGISRYLLSILGIGVVTVASFLGETGDLARFEHWKQIQTLAGLNFTEQSSGEHKGQTKITKRGKPELRNILYQASMTLVAKNQKFQSPVPIFPAQISKSSKEKAGTNSHFIKTIEGYVWPCQKKTKLRSSKSIGRISYKLD